MSIEIFSDYFCYIEKRDRTFNLLTSMPKNIFTNSTVIDKQVNPKYDILYSYINSNYECISEKITNYEWFLQHNIFQKKKLYMSFAINILKKHGHYLNSIPKHLRSYDISYTAILNDPYNIRWVDKNIENYYSLVKEAFLKHNNIIGLLQIPRKYVEQLKIDFPEKF